MQPSTGSSPLLGRYHVLFESPDRSLYGFALSDGSKSPAGWPLLPGRSPLPAPLCLAQLPPPLLRDGASEDTKSSFDARDAFHFAVITACMRRARSRSERSECVMSDSSERSWRWPSSSGSAALQAGVVCSCDSDVGSAEDSCVAGRGDRSVGRVRGGGGDGGWSGGWSGGGDGGVEIVAVSGTDARVVGEWGGVVAASDTIAAESVESGGAEAASVERRMCRCSWSIGGEPCDQRRICWRNPVAKAAIGRRTGRGL